MLNNLIVRRLFSALKVPIESIKRLREETSAPMGECKKALEDSEGDHEKAVLWLRQKGLSTAGKRASKDTREGVVASFVTPCRRKAVMLEVNCETDFVAKNELFLKFVNGLGARLLEDEQSINVQGLSQEQASTKFDEILEKTPAAEVLPEEGTANNMSEELKLVISRLQQNIRVRRAVTLYTEGCRYGSYVHRPYCPDIGLQACLVEISTEPQVVEEQAEETLNEFADDMATQVLGSPPKYISYEEIPEEVLEAQAEKVKTNIAPTLAKAPQQMHEQIISGKMMSQFYSKTLLGCMPYLLSNDGQQVSDVWTRIEGQTGTNINILRAVAWQCKE